MDRERREIDSVFKAVIAAVEETHLDALRPMEERQQEVEREAGELTQELKREIRELKETIGQLQVVADLKDHIHFLQVSNFTLT